VHRTYLTDMDRVQLNAGEYAAVMESSDIGKLTAEAVERFDNDDLKGATLKIAQ